ncbi:cytochrome C assembly family protein [Spectribacter hydrogenoxidans]|uniref:cytochrome C assembly family protein n=1 Tax=Spectribacter hydrogenoxidans TaxID=3075608 RepID=UPI003C12C4DA
MTTLTITLLILACAGYAAAGLLCWRHLHGAPVWPVHVTAGVAVAAHLAVLLLAMVEVRSVVIGVGGALSLFAWQAALLLFLAAWRQPVASLGLVVYPVALLCALAMPLLPGGAEAPTPLDWSLQLHVLLSLVAYGFLTLAAVQAALLSFQDHRLHNHRTAGLNTGLPPLQTMERLMFRLIAIGFALLTLAIVTGAVFLDNPLAQHLAHKTVLSVIAWAFFGILLWGHWRQGWRGRTAIRWTAGGYALLIAAYFGSKMVLELVLGRHW